MKQLPENADAEAMFRSGALLIEDNSGESLEGSREALQEGVRRIEGALRKGPIDAKKAFETLAHAYNALRSRAAATDEERQSFLERERECYRRLTQLDAGNPEWQMAYSVSTTDAASQLAELRVLARRYPNYVPGRQLLAERLCSEGHNSEGLDHVVAAAESMSPNDVDSGGVGLINVAWRCMGEPGAERVRRIIAARGGSGALRK